MRTAYLVCATERSGSTLLCEALAATGVAGRPAEYFEALRGSDVPRRPAEYFDGALTPELERLLPPGRAEPAPELAGAATYADYLAWAVEAGTTANGVFGAKLMWGHVGDLAGRLRDAGVSRAATDGDVLREVFPGADFVRIVRRDRVEQAVSLWRAIQTQRWRAAGESGDGSTPRAPVYHRDAIAHLARRLAEHERGWSALFARIGADPLTISYDDLVGDLPGCVDAVLDRIGAALPAGVTVKPSLARQADELSRSWVERFGRETGFASGSRHVRRALHVAGLLSLS